MKYERINSEEIQFDLTEDELLYLMSCMAEPYGYLPTEQFKEVLGVPKDEFQKLTSRLKQYRDEYNISF